MFLPPSVADVQAPAHAAADPDTWPGAAAAAVQQAEQLLTKCKAAAPSAALLQQQQQQGGSVGRGRAVSSSGRSLLFELAGVHCCCRGAGPNTARSKRRVSHAGNVSAVALHV